MFGCVPLPALQAVGVSEEAVCSIDLSLKNERGSAVSFFPLFLALYTKSYPLWQ